jgi:DNA-binding NarL/FixJ family response regulator
MQDIFISPLKKPISGWLEAFPNALFTQTLEDISLANYPDAVFWLHKNEVNLPELQLEEQPQRWLANAIQAIRTGAPNAKIIVLANLPNQNESILCLRMGAIGYSHAYTDAKVLYEIRAVVQLGGLWVGQDALRQLIESSTKRLGSQADFVESLMTKLTVREREVAEQVAKGQSNKEIARTLQITERTVKAHLAHIFERLGAKDRLHLALMLNKKME